MPSVALVETSLSSNRDQFHVAKRRKLSVAHEQYQDRAQYGSRIFAPFRTVGLVSPTSVPFTTTAVGKTSFQITTSVGQSLQTFDLKRGLQLVFITRPQTPGPITATTAWADRVAAAWSCGDERGIWIFKRGKKIDELQVPFSVDEDIVQLSVFGSWLVACCRTRIEVWTASTGEHYSTLQSPTAQNVLTGGVCTLPTFVNKIFAGREDGSVEIWNVSTAKLLYRILPPSSDAGPVTCLESTPAYSMLAIAYLGGQLVAHDVRFDNRVIELRAGTSESAPITTISFRSDGIGAGTDGRCDGVMATASYGSGNITLWDLNKGGRRVGVLRSAHGAPPLDETHTSGGITKVEFLSGQAVLVTTGLDNSLKTWIFDQSPFSPIPRILHSRSGHAGPVTTLNFLPNDAEGVEAQGKWLLSTSKDRSFWGFSLRRDGQSTELSQGSVQKQAKQRDGTLNGGAGASTFDLKAPEITCLACSLNRDGGMGALPSNKALWASAKQLKGRPTSTEQNITGWESVVTGHKDDRFARTWFWGRKRAGRWIFETGDGGHVSTVSVSPCGSFALVGSVKGSIDMYNLQSGHHRQSFPAKLTPAQAQKLHAQRETVVTTKGDGIAFKSWTKGQGKHTGAITGLHVDNLDKTVISCGSDGKIKFWELSTGILLHQLDWGGRASIIGMRPHRPSDLMTLNCEDGCIRIVDLETRRTVRELLVGEAVVHDLVFSNDGRWILAACSDALIRIWDLPTGHLIDAIRLASPCAALAFSPTGEYLALARHDSIGIDIWTNRALFAHVSTRKITEENVAQSTAPTTSGEGGQGILAAAFEGHEQLDEEVDGLTPSMDQLSSTVETLSLVPKSRWQTLLNLDVIRQRNKPKEPPKAPEKAPFFLPSLHNKKDQANAMLVVTDGIDTADAAMQSRLLRMDRTISESKFTLLLRQSGPAEEPFIEHIKTLSPAAADVEIRSLASSPPYEEPRAFVAALTARLRARRDYELVQAWMSVFLKCHGELLAEDSDLAAAMGEWRDEQRREADRLNQLTGYCAGVLGFLRGVQ